MNKKTSGISLVALVITIIVLIILTGSVIMTFMEGGIIDRAREAVFKNDIRTYQSILATKVAERQIKVSTGNGEDIPEITIADIPDFKSEYEDLITIVNGEFVLASEDIEEPYLTWLTDLGIGLGTGETATTGAKITDWDYYIKGTDVILIKYEGNDSKVVVPATYYLEENAYYKGNAAGTYNVKIQPNSNDEENIYTEIPDGGLFANTNIKSVEFESGVELISACNNSIPYMFYNCKELTTVMNIPMGSYITYIYTPTFTNCESLKTVSFTNDAVLERLGNIFSGCNATEVTIVNVSPDSPYLGEHKVGDTTINVTTDREISKEIKGVEGWESYISGTDIVLTKYIGTETEVYVPATYYLEKNAYYKGNGAGTYNVKLQPNSIILDGWNPQFDGGLFANNETITLVSFESGVTLMADCNNCIPHMFYNCSALEVIVNLPAGYGAYNSTPAFTGCESLREVHLTGEAALENAQSLFANTGSSAILVTVPGGTESYGPTIQVGDTTLTISAF